MAPPSYAAGLHALGHPLPPPSPYSYPELKEEAGEHEEHAEESVDEGKREEEDERSFEDGVVEQGANGDDEGENGKEMD